MMILGSDWTRDEQQVVIFQPSNRVETMVPESPGPSAENTSGSATVFIMLMVND